MHGVRHDVKVRRLRQQSSQQLDIGRRYSIAAELRTPKLERHLDVLGTVGGLENDARGIRNHDCANAGIMGQRFRRQLLARGLVGRRAAGGVRKARRQLVEIRIGAADDKAGIAALRKSVEADALGIDAGRVHRSAEHEIDGAFDVERTLPQHAQTIGLAHIGVVRVRMVDGNDDKPGIRQRLGHIVEIKVPAAIAM